MLFRSIWAQAEPFSTDPSNKRDHLIFPLGAPDVATIVAGTAVLSLGVVGVPGVATFLVPRIPVYTAVGIPLDILGPMIAVDLVPDTFRTVNNVTADLAVTAVVAKGRPSFGAEGD